MQLDSHSFFFHSEADPWVGVMTSEWDGVHSPGAAPWMEGATGYLSLPGLEG